MSFFREIATILGVDEAKAALGYHYINYDGLAVYIEGIKSVLRVEEERMAFKLGKGVLYVEGSELRLDDLSVGSVLIRGKILAVHDGSFSGKAQPQETKA